MLSVNYITTFLNEPQNPIEKYYYNKLSFFERNDMQSNYINSAINDTINDAINDATSDVASITINDPSNIETKKLTYSYFKNMKIDEIKEICIKNNILLQKKSDKTLKMINKLKNDLIEDLVIIENPIL